MSDSLIWNETGPSLWTMVNSPWPLVTASPAEGQSALLSEQMYMSDTQVVLVVITVLDIPSSLSRSDGQVPVSAVFTVAPAAQNVPSGVVMVTLFSLKSECWVMSRDPTRML